MELHMITTYWWAFALLFGFQLAMIPTKYARIQARETHAFSWQLLHILLLLISLSIFVSALYGIVLMIWDAGSQLIELLSRFPVVTANMLNGFSKFDPFKLSPSGFMIFIAVLFYTVAQVAICVIIFTLAFHDRNNLNVFTRAFYINTYHRVRLPLHLFFIGIAGTLFFILLSQILT